MAAGAAALRLRRQRWTWRPVLVAAAGARRAGVWSAAGRRSGAGVVLRPGPSPLLGGRLIWRRRRERRVRAATGGRSARGVRGAGRRAGGRAAARRSPSAEAARRWPGLGPVVDALGPGLRRARPRCGGSRPSPARATCASSRPRGRSRTTRAPGSAHAVARVASRIRAQRPDPAGGRRPSWRRLERRPGWSPPCRCVAARDGLGRRWQSRGASCSTPRSGGAVSWPGSPSGSAGLWWIEAIADQVEPGVTVLAAVAAGARGPAPPAGPAAHSDRRPRQPSRTSASGRSGWRPLLCLLAGVGAGLFLGGPLGLVVAPGAAAAAWVALARSEPAAVRRERELAARELPHFVDLFSCALRVRGATAGRARRGGAGLPGADRRAARRCARAAADGRGPGAGLGRPRRGRRAGAFGRTLARAETSGSSVGGRDRAPGRRARAAAPLAAVEDRARRWA